ncbi:Protein CBG10600 [Caenorhabditis briggsae]|uniref:Protein CBG10600 n=2 Tax=Caenorhabditis briggsae TaxID=6238 RepID=A8XBG0_CAEBR|nr:Protein CBG10600 [Caenorhabditis briggsae]CAP29975.2 Protein CBG10600 [Caenorhabditis briggsae]
MYAMMSVLTSVPYEDEPTTLSAYYSKPMTSSEPPKFEHEYEAEEYGKTELMECQTDQVRIIRWSTLSVV